MAHVEDNETELPVAGFGDHCQSADQKRDRGVEHAEDSLFQRVQTPILDRRDSGPKLPVEELFGPKTYTIWVVVKIMIPFLGTLNIRCRIIIGIQKGTIILTTTHMNHCLNS